MLTDGCEHGLIAGVWLQHQINIFWFIVLSTKCDLVILMFKPNYLDSSVHSNVISHHDSVH